MTYDETCMKHTHARTFICIRKCVGYVYAGACVYCRYVFASVDLFIYADIYKHFCIGTHISSYTYTQTSIKTQAHKYTCNIHPFLVHMISNSKSILSQERLQNTSDTTISENGAVQVTFILKLLNFLNLYVCGKLLLKRIKLLKFLRLRNGKSCAGDSWLQSMRKNGKYSVLGDDWLRGMKENGKRLTPMNERKRERNEKGHG